MPKRIPTKDHKVAVIAMLTVHTRQAVERIATREQVSLSEVVRQAVERHVDRKQE